MLVPQAAKLKKKRWAVVYPNYEYGQSAVATFKKLLTAAQPDVEFVSDQAAPLGKVDAGAVAQAISDAKPDAIYVVLFGADLAKFVREGTTRGTFKDVSVVGLLTGEPEYLDPLKDEAPIGWIVTGYPWYSLDTPEHKAFLTAYRESMTDARLWPADAGTAEGMLDFFLLEKAFYEIEYELAHRPDWLRVPLAGTLRILSQYPEVS